MTCIGASIFAGRVSLWLHLCALGCTASYPLNCRLTPVLGKPLKCLKRLLSPGIPCRHLRALPAPVRLHRLQRSSPARHPDGKSHTPRVARVTIPQTRGLAMLSTRRLICDTDSPKTDSSSACRTLLHVCEVTIGNNYQIYKGGDEQKQDQLSMTLMYQNYCNA